MKNAMIATFLALILSQHALSAFGGNYDDVNPLNRNRHGNYGIRQEISAQRVWNNTIYTPNGQRLNPFNGQPREYQQNPQIYYDDFGYF